MTSVAPQIDQEFLLPAADLEFPIIVYQHSGAPVYQAIYTPTALTPLFERGALTPAASWEFPTMQQKFRERYEAGDPEVDLLGEPSGKFDYYVLYSRSKPSFSTTPMMTPEPSWSDTPKSDSVARKDDSWEVMNRITMVKKLETMLNTISRKRKQTAFPFPSVIRRLLVPLPSSYPASAK